MPLKLSADEVSELGRYMEGWVGGLQLFGLSLKGKYTPHGLGDILTRALKETTDYLLDEVINAQPERIKTFVCKTAILDRFNVELCRDITGFSDASAIIDYIRRNHLFLIPLDTEGTWYRYHHLFSDAVRKLVRISSPDMSSQVHKMAAFWFAQNDYLNDAFQNAFASEDFEFAADLLEDNLLFLHERYQVSAALAWLGRLPHKTFVQRALLRLIECSLKMESLQLLEIEAVLNEIRDHWAEALNRYDESKKTLCEDLFKYYMSILCFYRNPGKRGIKVVCRTIRAGLPRQFHLSFVKDLTAARNLWRGDFPLACNVLQKVSTLVFSSKTISNRVMWSRSMSIVEKLQGHLTRAESIAQEALSFLDQKGLSDDPLKFMLYYPLGWISLERNDLQSAFEYAKGALRYQEETKSASGIAESNMSLYCVHMERGEGEIAGQFLQKVQSILRRIGDLKTMASVDATVARYSIVQGDFEAAQHWARRRSLDMDEPFSYLFAYECVVYAQLLVRLGRYEEAAPMLETLRTGCVNQNMLEQVIDIDLLRSAAFYALNDPDRAKTITEETLEWCETEGYILPFVRHAPIISPILIDLSKNSLTGQRSSTLINVMRACNIGGHSAVIQNQSESHWNAHLTPREIEIIKMMASGLRDKEIANKTFLSLYTIKTHAKHIFRKLNVRTRVEAVREAGKLGIGEQWNRKRG